MGNSESKGEADNTQPRFPVGDTSSNHPALEGASEPTSEPASSNLTQLNDSVWLLHKPREGPHNLDVIFVHGFQVSNDREAFWKTWLSRDQKVIWPQAWLGGCFPNARILSISYDSRLERHDGQMDPFLIVENLINDIIWSSQCNAGQNSPVIFVGHCIGGIIIKQFLLKCHEQENLMFSKDRRRGQLETFLRNCKGIFYYATPHAGSGLTEAITCAKEINQPIVESLKVLSKETARINGDFNSRQKNPALRLPTWMIGETHLTEFQVLNKKFKVQLVPEASARQDADWFYWASADHFDVPRAKDKSTCIIFCGLRDFIQIQWDLERGDGAQGRTPVSTETLEGLVTALTKDNGSSAGARRNSARALAELTRRADHDLNSKIITAGALEKLINGLDNGDNGDLQEQCARAMCNLACGDLETCRIIANCEGALKGLIGALTKTSGHNRDAQRFSARALSNLAAQEDHDLKLKIISAPGALKELVNGLCHDNRDLQKECAGALANLACGDRKIRREIQNFPGAIMELDRLVRDSGSNLDAQSYSTKALCDLKSRSSFRSMLKSLKRRLCVS